MLNERMSFEDLLHKLVEYMVILYEQRRLWADWEDKPQVKRWPPLGFIVPSPTAASIFQLQEGIWEIPLKRFTEESTFLCVTLQERNTILQ